LCTIMRNIIHQFKKANQSGMSMGVRLFAFLIVLVAAVIFGVLAVLLATGVLAFGGGAVQRNVNEGFAGVSGRLTSFCGATSVQLVLLSNSISKDIEYQLANRQLQVNNLKAHPELLEEITGNELGRLQFALGKTKCSGVFMILDATVNPALANAANSKAGLYIRHTEPKVTDPDEERYVRGYPWIAYRNGMLLQSQWAMEFDVTDCGFYHQPLDAYNKSPQPLTNLYYWCFEKVFPTFGEDTVLCSVPLVDSAGNAFGVCGFEISAGNFAANYAPEDSKFKRIISMFSLLGDAGLDTGNALFSKANQGFIATGKGPLRLTGGNALLTYESETGPMLVGVHKEIKVYPADSVFAGQKFAVSLLMPKQDFDRAVWGTNVRFMMICVMALILGVGISLLLSARYLNPIQDALESIHPDKIDSAAKTNIREIDQLIERIKLMRTKENPLPDNLFEDFIARVETLTRTERKIFDYYFAGLNGNEILSAMQISANTLKVHNNHIYTKLGVSSKDELLLYIDLIKKSGLTGRIS